MVRPPKPCKRLSVYIPQEEIIIIDKFKIILAHSNAIPKNDYAKIKSENQIMSYAIRMLLKNFVDKNYDKIEKLNEGNFENERPKTEN